MRILPEHNPKPVMITAIVVFALFMVCGMGYSGNLAFQYGKPFLPLMIFFTLLAVGAVFAVLWTWHFLAQAAHKASFKKAELDFRQGGYTRDLAGTFLAAPYPTDEERVINAYLLSAAESYKEAENALQLVDRSELSVRTMAMLQTTYLRIYSMTGRQEKVKRLLENVRGKNDAAYEMNADLNGTFLPYLDDALDYYLITAMYYLQRGDQASAAPYMKNLMFQISKHDEADRVLFPKIVDLCVLFATSRFQDAHTLENDLKGEIGNFSGSLSQPHKTELLRRIEQARIYSPFLDPQAQSELKLHYTNENAAEIPVNADHLTERRLPTEAELSGAPKPENFGLDLF